MEIVAQTDVLDARCGDPVHDPVHMSDFCMYLHAAELHNGFPEDVEIGFHQH